MIIAIYIVKCCFVHSYLEAWSQVNNIIQRLSLKLRWHLQGCTFPKRKFMLQPPTSGDQYCYTVLSGWSICRSQDFRGAPIVDDWWHRWCVQLWMMTCKTLDADIPFYNSYWKFIGVCHLYPAIYLKKPRKSCTCRGISDMFRTILNDLIADIYIYMYIIWCIHSMAWSMTLSSVTSPVKL